MLKNVNWDGVWREKGTDAWVLMPLSALYTAGWVLYELVYRLKIKRPKRPHRPVVCVGNLMAGGTGKTPVVIQISRVLRDLGKEVVISVNGYGAPKSANATVALPGELDARIWGDEAAVIRTKLPNVPMIVGRDRVRAAQICRDLYPNAVLLLDDGLQHLPLYKDISIVLDPSEVMNAFCLPSGPYREPRVTGRARATLVIPEQFHLAPGMLSLVQTKGKTASADSGVNLLCAIARPDRFTKSIEDYGYRIISERILPDHDNLQDPALFSGLDPEIPLVVTEKDWVKIQHRKDLAKWTILVAMYDVPIEPAEKFKSWLKGKLDAIEA